MEGKYKAIHEENIQKFRSGLNSNYYRNLPFRVGLPTLPEFP